MAPKKTTKPVDQDREALRDAAGKGQQQTKPSEVLDGGKAQDRAIDRRLIHWGLLFSRDSRRPQPPQRAESDVDREALADYEARGLDLNTGPDNPDD